MSISKSELIYPELSYEIIGAAFGVFNSLGWGLSEKSYQEALAAEFKDRNVNSTREVYIPLNYKDANITRYFADFIVDNKILLELKVVSRLGYQHIKQVDNYLANAGLKLGILLYFTKDGVKYRRIINSRISN